MKMQVFLQSLSVERGVVVRTSSTGGSAGNASLVCSCLLCLACSTNSLRSAELPLAVKSLCLLWSVALAFVLRSFSTQIFSAGAPLDVALQLRRSVIFCLLFFLLFLSVLVCLVLHSSRNKTPFVAANPGVPNTLNNCSAARVNVKHKSASKFLLMPSYNNKNSHFNNWGRGRVDLVV